MSECALEVAAPREKGKKKRTAKDALLAEIIDVTCARGAESRSVEIRFGNGAVVRFTRDECGRVIREVGCPAAGELRIVDQSEYVGAGGGDLAESVLIFLVKYGDYRGDPATCATDEPPLFEVLAE